MKQKLSSLRKKRGLSQWALSIKSGVSRYKLSLAECGYVKLSYSDGMRIAKVLKLSVNKISPEVESAFIF